MMFISNFVKIRHDIRDTNAKHSDSLDTI